MQLPDQERWVYMTVKAMIMSPPEMVGPGGYSDMFTIGDFTFCFAICRQTQRTKLALRARIPLTYIGQEVVVSAMGHHLGRAARNASQCTSP